MRISKARFALLLSAMIGIAGCQTGSGSNWWRFGKKDTASESALADAPSHNRPSLPSSTASPAGLASNNSGTTATWGTRPDTSTASNTNWGNPAASAANNGANMTASYTSPNYPSTGMQSTASTSNPYAQAANNWGTGGGAATANSSAATYQAQNGFYDPNAYASQGAPQQYNFNSQYSATPANNYATAGTGVGNTGGTYNGYTGAAAPTNYNTASTGYNYNSAATPSYSASQSYNSTAATGASSWSNPAGTAYGDPSATTTAGSYDSTAATASTTPANYGAAPGSAYPETQTADSRSAWGNNAAGNYASGASIGSNYTPPAYQYSGSNDSSGAWAASNTAGSTQSNAPSTALPQRLGNYRPGGTGDYRPATSSVGATSTGSQSTAGAAPANYESGLSQASGAAATTLGGSVSAGATSFR